MSFQKFPAITSILMALSLLIGVAAAFGTTEARAADSITPVTCRFLGVVRDDGIIVPAGYKVVAKVEGVEKGSTTTNAEGKYGYEKPLEITGYEGKTIQFWINGIMADQGGVIQEGDMTYLDLTIISPNPPSKTTTAPTGSKPAPGTYTPTYLRGLIMNDGRPVPAGLKVVAQVRGIEYTSTKTNAEGKYGFDSVFGVEAQDGDVISFYINGSRADQTYAAEGGSMAQLDLTYKDTAGSTTPPAAPPAPSSPATTPASTGSPAPSPKPAEAAPLPSSNSSGGSTAQPVVIGFVSVLALLCLAMIYIILKRRQPQPRLQSQSQYDAQTDTQAQADIQADMQAEMQSRLRFRSQHKSQQKSTGIAVRKPEEPNL